MNILSSPRIAAVTCAVAALLVFATPASAQVLDANLDITSDGFFEVATPLGAPATTNITISYDCGGLSGDTPITVTADENVSGASATISPASISPAEPPDCTAGETQTSAHTLSVSVGKDAPAGADIPVTVKVEGENALTAGQTDEQEFAATVGPYVDVTFTPKTDAYEVPAGESTVVVIQIETDSNVEIMTMPDVKGLPEGWQKPDLFPMNVQSPLAGGNGTGLMEFEVFVPANAPPGDQTIELEIFAHSTGDTYVATDNQTIPLTFSVVPGTNTADDDTEESPAVAPIPLAVLGAAAFALLRRRD